MTPIPDVVRSLKHRLPVGPENATGVELGGIWPTLPTLLWSSKQANSFFRLFRFVFVVEIVVVPYRKKCFGCDWLQCLKGSSLLSGNQILVEGILMERGKELLKPLL